MKPINETTTDTQKPLADEAGPENLSRRELLSKGGERRPGSVWLRSWGTSDIGHCHMQRGRNRSRSVSCIR